MTVYSTQFFLGTVTAGGSTPIYTVPAGYTAVIRDIELEQYGGALANGRIEIVGFAGIYSYTPSGLLLPAQWTGRAVMTPAQVLSLTLTGGDWAALISGYLLDGVVP